MSEVTTSTSQKAPASVKSLLANESIKNRFTEILGQKAPGFISSILSIVNNSTHLSAAEPNSVIGAAAIAATLDLPINGNLGFAHIVPYKSNGTTTAQFQMGWKGYVQLALRTGQYLLLNVTEIYAGQLKSYNSVTGEYVWDFNSPALSKEVIGYAAYFKLTTGFEKTVYWNVGKISDHGKKYSASFKKGYGLWVDNFDAMARKTLVKHIISQWGIMSIEMRTAVQMDDAVVRENEQGDLTPNYVDNPHEYQAANVVSSTTPDPAKQPAPDKLNSLNL